jgi:hypothetical protein
VSESVELSRSPAGSVPQINKKADMAQFIDSATIAEMRLNKCKFPTDRLVDLR